MKFNKKLFFASSLSILALAPAAAIISCGGNDSISNPNNANPNTSIPSVNQQLYDKYKNFLISSSTTDVNVNSNTPLYRSFSDYLTNPQKRSDATNYDQFQEMNSSNINNILNNKDKLLEVLNLSLLESTQSFIGSINQQGVNINMKDVWIINDQNFDYDVNTKTINKMEIIGYSIRTGNDKIVTAVSCKCEIYNIQLISSSLSKQSICFSGIKMVPVQNKKIMAKLTSFEAEEGVSNLTNEEVKIFFGDSSATDSAINALRNSYKELVNTLLNKWKPILNQEKAVPVIYNTYDISKCFPFKFYVFDLINMFSNNNLNVNNVNNVNNDPISYSAIGGVIPIVEIKDPNNLNAPLPAWNVDLSQVGINATKDVNNTLKITITNGEKIISTKKNDILVTYFDTTTNNEGLIDTTGIEIQNGTITIPNVTQNITNVTIYINGISFSTSITLN